MAEFAITGTLAVKPAESPRQIVSLLHGGTAMLVASVFGNGLGYLFGLFVARMLGAADFGIYALGLTVFNVATLVMLAGLDSGMVKFVSESLAKGDPRAAHRVLMQAVAAVCAVGLCASLGLVLSGESIAGDLYSKPGLSGVLTIFALAVPLSMLATILVSALVGSKAIGTVALIRNLWEPLGKFLFFGLLLWWGLGVTAVASAVAMTLAGSLVLAFKALHGAGWFDQLSPWSARDMRPLVSFCAPMFLTTLFGVIGPRSDILFLGYWAGAQDVGIYQATFQTAAVLILIAAAFDVSFSPLAAGAASTGDRSSLAEAYRVVSRWTFTIALPLMWLYMAAGKDLLSLFGPTFEQGAASLALLAFGQLINTLTTYAHSILLMSGHTVKVMWNAILTSLVLIGANWLLIPVYGITGAAAAVCLGLTFTGLLRVFQVRHVHGLHPFSWNWLKPLAAGAAATAAGSAATLAVGGIPLAAAVSLFGLVYAVLLLGFGIEGEDRVMIAGLVERTRLWKAR